MYSEKKKNNRIGSKVVQRKPRYIWALYTVSCTWLLTKYNLHTRHKYTHTHTDTNCRYYVRKCKTYNEIKRQTHARIRRFRRISSDFWKICAIFIFVLYNTLSTNRARIFHHQLYARTILCTYKSDRSIFPTVNFIFNLLHIANNVPITNP